MDPKTKSNIKKIFTSPNMKSLWLALFALATLTGFCILASLPVSASVRFGLVLGCGIVVVIVFRFIYREMLSSEKAEDEKEIEE